MSERKKPSERIEERAAEFRRHGWKEPIAEAIKEFLDEQDDKRDESHE